MDDQKKDYTDPKRLPKGKRSQLQTHNLLTDDVKNTNGTEKGGDL